LQEAREQMRVETATKFLALGVVAFMAACTGSNGKDGTRCTLIANADGTQTLSCGTDGGMTIASGKSCKTVAIDGGSEVVCDDGTMTIVTNGTNGQSCLVVSNGDGTRTISCPNGDGGVTTFNVKDALYDYTTMSGKDKAALDLKIAVSAVTVPSNGQPVVAFMVKDVSGNVVKGLPPGDLRFALLKLVPATTATGPNPATVNGSANDTWVSYMATNATSPSSSETATSGVLTDNGDGTYSYTFAKNVTDATAAGTTYDASAIHRLVMMLYELGNPFAPVNLTRDFIPATGKEVTGQNQKVDQTACLECHSSFRAKAGGTGAFHGGDRYDVNICVACHNDQRRFQVVPGTGATPLVDLDTPGVVDASGAWVGTAVRMNGEAFINLPVYIHKIHMGDQLTLTGGSYTAIPKPYDITFPQDIDNCTKCHRNVFQADNFKNNPSRRACGSCHDDISFLAVASIPAGRKPHPGGPRVDDSQCATCHPATGPKTLSGIGVLDAHVAIAAPDPNATWLTTAAGANANTNAGYLPAAGMLPVGAAKITYDLKSVTRNANKNPSITFRLIKDGTPVVFNTYAAGMVTELMPGFVNSPSVYFVYALPQDGITAPADFNVSASGYIKNIWNGTATGAGAGTMTFDTTTAYYTITLTGVTIPDSATMLTGGVGYTYSLSSTPPLTQINLPAYPYGGSDVYPTCIAGKMCGGLIVTAPDVQQVATDASPAKVAYTARRAIVSNDNCKACHAQLGVNPTFHAGQRNDGSTCAFCHRPNQTSSGWSASSSSYIHRIHGASERTVDDTWHAACPAGTSITNETCSKDNADPYFAKVTYPGILNNCQQCHLAGTYDFSVSASAAAVSNLLMSTVATGKIVADISTSPYVLTDGTDYGAGYATANTTSGSRTGVDCTVTPVPDACKCTLDKPCQADGTTLVNSPITAACSACHDAPTAISHMKMMGGSFYDTRTLASSKPEQCMMCHGPGTVASIASVHQ
jgi:OmcA/MtrC family decaheme c-type cytochrome